MPKSLPELSRPHWARWLAAAALAWLAAPLFSPFMWRFLMVEGIDMVAILAVGFWTYFIGLPLAGIGIVLLLLVTFIRYQAGYSLALVGVGARRGCNRPYHYPDNHSAG